MTAATVAVWVVAVGAHVFSGMDADEIAAVVGRVMAVLMVIRLLAVGGRARAAARRWAALSEELRK